MASDDRPVFRPAEVVTKEAALEAFGSGDVERIRLALIDGSRCLDGAWVYPQAWRFVAHPSAQVRWAAMFALGWARRELLRVLIADEWDHDEDWPILTITGIAASDPDADVRSMAGEMLSDLISEMEALLRRKVSGP